MNVGGIFIHKINIQAVHLCRATYLTRNIIDYFLLLSLLEAARWAPSSYNYQPWRFIVATKDDITQYNRLLNILVEFNQCIAHIG